MTNIESISVDQALYGYSNGHRQLAASTKLSSVDTYRLAALSDLASGVTIEGNQSYLSGAKLPESGRYALLRTWLAPEMPRPGCVWSHVLLLSQEVVSSQANLSVLDRYFRKPSEATENFQYSSPIEVSKSTQTIQCDPELLTELIDAYYTDRAVKTGLATATEMEQAILVMWSQQWPLLRLEFSFRSAVASSSVSDGALQLDASLAKASDGWNDWAQTAAEEANSAITTPLKRFLWRYGKDFRNPRVAFPRLVEIYRNVSLKNDDISWLASALSDIPKSDARSLRRDFLGLSPPKLTLVPSASPCQIIEWLALDWGPSQFWGDDELISVFEAFPVESFPRLIATAYDKKKELGKKFDQLLGSVLPSVLEKHLVDKNTPVLFVALALKRRPELICIDALIRLDSNQLISLLEVLKLSKDQRMIWEVILGLPINVKQFEKAMKYIDSFVDVAVKLDPEEKIDASWRALSISRTELHSRYIENVSGEKDTAKLAYFLDYPDGGSSFGTLWLNALSSKGAEAPPNLKTRLEVYILVLFASDGLDKLGSKLVEFLPKMRQQILNSELPDDAYNELDRTLPSHRDYWDLNKRLLKLIRRHYKEGKPLDELVQSLNLNDDEREYATNSDVRSLTENMVRIMLPWSRWD
ncbi:MAG: hypothetical protein AB8C02_01695 [Halioglobus sp.]